MTEPGDAGWDGAVESFQRCFMKDMTTVQVHEERVTLMWPSLEYTGASAAGHDIPMMGWRVDICMYLGTPDGEMSERRLAIGFLDLFTLPLNGYTAEALDAVSTDTASYIELLDGADLSEAVQEQFNYPIVSGLLMLDRAYVHPSVRGNDIGAWAVTQAVHDLTFGSAVLFAAHPSPVEARPGQSEEAGAAKLAEHWTKAGLQPIDDCPKLVGETTDGPSFIRSRKALRRVTEVEIAVAKSALTIF